VEALQKSGFRIVSLTKCLHNAEVPVGLDSKNKMGTMRHYLFYWPLKIKTWTIPFDAGTVPVYFGASNVHDHVPTHSIIVVNDFDDLAVHLQKAANGKELYQDYQK
jgi:hypothetical protein